MFHSKTLEEVSQTMKLNCNFLWFIFCHVHSFIVSHPLAWSFSNCYQTIIIMMMMLVYVGYMEETY